MGWCHEFGCQIVSGCNHPMTAGEEACTCTVCEVVCTGRFGACADVWARGPQPVHIVDLQVSTAIAEEVLEPVPVPDEAPAPLEEVSAPTRDAATEVLSWLRGEFDYLIAQVRALSDRLARQESVVRAVAGERQEELDVSLAELEGCAAQLRNEAAGLRDMRVSLAESLPRLVAESATPAVNETVAGAVSEVRAAVAELGGALAEVLPAAVAQAVAPAPPGPPREDEDGVGPAVGDVDPVTQLHEAQDEAAEWFSIVVDEAIRRAVERYLAPAVSRAPVAPPEPAVDVDPVGVDPVVGDTADAALGPSTNGVATDPSAPGLPREPVPAEQPPPEQPPPEQYGTGPHGDESLPGHQRAGAGGDDPTPPGPSGSTPAAVEQPTTGPPAVGSAEDEAAHAPADDPRRPAEEPARPDSSREPSLEMAGLATAHLAPPDAAPVPGPPVEPLLADVAGAVPEPPPGGTGAGPGPVPAADHAPAGQAEPPSAASWGDPTEDEPDRASAVACVLPGVAVGPTLALGVSSALRRARLRRRRRRRAGAPAAGLHRQDPYVGDLCRRLERFALSRRDLAVTPNGAGSANGAAALVAVAEHDDREVGIDLAEGPIALVGPGAADAGRAIVTTLLAQTEPAATRVVAVADVLPPGPSFPGLDRVDDLTVALDQLDVELDRRRQLAADGSPRAVDPGSPARDTPARSAERDLPLLVLAVASVPEPLAGRIAGLVGEGPGHGLTALGVGCELEGAVTVTLQPGAAVRSVSPGGRAESLSEARLFTLSRGATTELLDLLAAARTDDEATLPTEVDDEAFPVVVPSEPPPIEVRLLGTYRIDVGGTEIRSGLRAKARELLAFYLLHPEGTTLDAATEALWPEADPGRGSEWFWTALGNLRTTLRRATGTKELRVIERDGDRYRIEPLFDVDLWRFQAALPPAPKGSTSDPEWAAALQAAADLYGGELLAGVDWAWAEVPRDDLRRRAVDVLVSLAATRLVVGDVPSALDALSRAVEVDPVAEQLYRRIMRLHARQSRPDEVAATFRRLKARLNELDLEPTAESEKLVEELCGPG